ncbi:ATP-binding protein [Marinilabiliaceae bacterium JC017]|nr:ATP-binding protein [Marinilabiliaceae bacterium JC017]
MTDEVKLDNVKHVLLVASGKGGVGKSTVAANLAISLAREGYATGLLDADLYGPSVPILFDIEDKKPMVTHRDGQSIIEPIEKYGIRIMSIGLMTKKEDAMIWRGPMASKTLTQIITSTNWGKLDYLVIDMPPGTGDICITLSQKLKQAFALVVITPQKLATADGLKAANMFRHPSVNIPMLGIVENMSYFVPEKHPDEQYFIFGKDGGEQLAQQVNSNLLAQIPLVMDVCELTDHGHNVFQSGNKILIDAFQELALQVAEKSNTFMYVKPTI